MSVDLGAVVARVIYEDAEFQAGIKRSQAMLRAFGAEASKSAAGTAKLDEGLTSVGASGTKAAAGVDRATKATVAQTAASQKAAAQAARSATAALEVGRVMDRTATASERVQAATLRQTAANSRLAATSAEAGSAEAKQAAATARLASAQASAIASSAALTKAQGTAGARMVATGARINKSLTLPLLAVAGVSIKTAMDFEAATNVYVTAAGESEKNLGVVRAGIKKTAVETGTSIKNLTDATYILEKANYRGANSTILLNAAAKGAKEENAQLTDVVQAMTSVMASYHLPATAAVQVMNALKTGAGQAKVTMEDYAKSLSTVIPIASANHIALEQVLGALSTLTQHGTTAAESTQELAATIRALAAPNRVAMNQMQQLGLSVNDVTKNIGKRGLTGTIDLLVGAITSHMGPAGLVLQKSFNQSKSAMADVQTMLAEMPPQVRKLADAYGAGKITLGDWRTELKKLPTDQAALATQYKTLTDKAKGFNTLLRTGDPAAQTFTSALKKMAGGAIGLNTVLQLSGENTAGFKQRTDEVGASLRNTSKDVEGWKSTAKLAATQAAQFKQELHVLAIDAGANLLPMFTHIVHGTEDVVHGIGNLSHTQKMVLGWSVGVIAALGPVLAIGGRLATVSRGFGTFLGGTGTRLAGFAGASETSAARVGTAMRGMGAALGGAAIGIGIGELTKNMSTGAQAIGALTSAAAGAAIGFQVGGPWGAAIGGGVGLLSNLATHLFGAGDAAKKNVSGIDSFTQAILRDNDALGKNVTALVATDLNKKIGKTGKTAFNFAAQIGVDPKTLTDAVMGVKSARAKIDALVAQGKAIGDLTSPTGKVNAAQAQILGVAVGSTRTEAQTNQLIAFAKAVYNVGQAVGSESDQAKKATQAAKDYTAATSAAGKNDTARAKALKAITQQQADAAKALKGLDVQVATHGTSLDQKTPDGKSNAAMLDGVLAKYKAIEQAQILAGVSATTASKNFDASTAAMRKQAVAAGLSGEAVDGLTKKYKMTPQAIVTYMIANIAKATASADQLQTIINSVQQGKVPGLKADSSQARAVIATLRAQIDRLSLGVVIPVHIQQSGSLAGNIVSAGGGHTSSNKATGGLITGPGTGTSDDVPIMASNGEFVSTDKSRRRNQAALAAGNAGATLQVAHYAAGGVVGHYATGGTVSAATARSLTSTGTSLAHYELKGDVSGVTDALNTLDSKLKAAGLPSAYMSRLSADNKKIIAATAARAAAATRLAAANQALANAKNVMAQERSTISTALVGSFDITTAGADANGKVTGGGIAAQAKQALARAKAFYAGMNRLNKMAFFPPSYLKALAEKGPDALPEVQGLLSLPIATLKEIAAEKGEMNKLGASLGTSISQRLDGAAVKSAQVTVSARQREVAAAAKLQASANKSLVDDLMVGLSKVGLKASFKQDGYLYLAFESSKKAATTSRGTAR